MRLTTPPILLGMGLVFWGWQTGYLVLALFLALFLEGHRYLGWRWDFKQSDFNRIADYSALGVFGIIVYLFLTRDLQQVPFALLTLFPVVFLPLLGAQVFSVQGKIPPAALFWTFRHRPEFRERGQKFSVDLSFPYLVFCLLSASAANTRTPWFFLGIFVLVVWALASLRSPRYSSPIWISLMLGAGIGGFLGQIGLHTVQNYVETNSWKWFSKNGAGANIRERTVAFLGGLEELKLSSQIQFRVFNLPRSETILVRTALYNKFLYTDHTDNAAWLADVPNIETLAPTYDGATWILHNFSGSQRQITIAENLGEGEIPLKLPNGTVRISGLSLTKLIRTEFDTVCAAAEPGLVEYKAHFGEGIPSPSKVRKLDLVIPVQDQAALSQLASELNLMDCSPRTAVGKIAQFFRSNFSYSLKPSPAQDNLTSLTTFLLNSRAGHCELFATATTLLLRSVGIPARYARGYLVHEYSSLEQGFVVRTRHAHAWSMAYYDGFWNVVDTTPPDWTTLDAQSASSWWTVSDFFSWLRFKYGQWQAGTEESMLQRYWWVALVVLGALFVWRFSSRVVFPRLQKIARNRQNRRTRPGSDSPLLKIEHYLSQVGYTRSPWETWTAFVARVKQEAHLRLPLAELIPILELHYRYRFDPEGHSPETRMEMEIETDQWLTLAQTISKS